MPCTSEREAVTDEELAEVERLDTTHCTGVSAGWCPVHGDCTCPRDGTDTREEQSETCPLHGGQSPHGDDTDDAPQIKRSVVLRLAVEVRQGRLWRTLALALIATRGRGNAPEVLRAIDELEQMGEHVPAVVRLP